MNRARPSVPRAPGTVEIVTIGDELLLGHTIDTNAAFLGRSLGQAGFRVARRSTVADARAEIAEAVNNALSRVDIVVCTGGLGPTPDDVTRDVVAELFGVPLEVRPDLLAALQARYRRRGIAMPERNITQAQVPQGAHVLHNARGTAPGLVLTRADGRRCILLPGVPHELRGMTQEELIPFLAATTPGLDHGFETRPIRYRLLRTTGMAESAIADRVDHLLGDLAPLTLAFLPGFAGVDLRLTSWGELSLADADTQLEHACARVRDLLADHVYGEEGDELASVVGRLLRARGWRVALAESCTGGLLGKLFSDAPGASDYLEGGVIAYSNEFKETWLDVSASTLLRHGAVSETTVREMVLGVQRAAHVEAALAITGIAGPAGGTPDKPVGTVWLAAALGPTTQTRCIIFPGDREEIRERSAQAALAMLWQLLKTQQETTWSTQDEIGSEKR